MATFKTMTVSFEITTNSSAAYIKDTITDLIERVTDEQERVTIALEEIVALERDDLTGADLKMVTYESGDHDKARKRFEAMQEIREAVYEGIVTVRETR